MICTATAPATSTTTQKVVFEMLANGSIGAAFQLPISVYDSHFQKLGVFDESQLTPAGRAERARFQALFPSVISSADTIVCLDAGEEYYCPDDGLFQYQFDPVTNTLHALHEDYLTFHTYWPSH